MEPSIDWESLDWDEMLHLFCASDQPLGLEREWAKAGIHDTYNTAWLRERLGGVQ